MNITFASMSCFPLGQRPMGRAIAELERWTYLHAIGMGTSSLDGPGDGFHAQSDQRDNALVAAIDERRGYRVGFCNPARRLRRKPEASRSAAAAGGHRRQG